MFIPDEEVHSLNTPPKKIKVSTAPPLVHDFEIKRKETFNSKLFIIVMCSIMLSLSILISSYLKNRSLQMMESRIHDDILQLRSAYYKFQFEIESDIAKMKVLPVHESHDGIEFELKQLKESLKAKKVPQKAVPLRYKSKKK